MNTLEKEINVASKESTSGHFVRDAKNVIKLDDITETSFIEGDSILSSKNHTDLEMRSDCLITIQNVYNPFSKLFEKSRD